MVFNANLVAVINSNGKVLKETRENDNNIVFMPFGNEYSIMLKNLNAVKALVDVEIDGRSAISGLIIYPNSSVELERFFENNMSKGHKFKFIEKTDDIKNYRGDKVEDGIIRISYRFEENPITHYWWNTYRTSWPGEPKFILGFDTNENYTMTTGDVTNNINAYYSNMVTENPEEIRSVKNNVYLDSLNDEGITVEGNESKQSFTYEDIEQLESTEHVINIQLKGQYPTKGEVKKPLTVNKKIQCKYCGKSSKSNCKFCSNCGAALI